MLISPDDAKTDVILVGAVFVFGRVVLGILTNLPFYPQTGLGARLLDVVWIVVLTALVPVLLARYRQDGSRAFGLGGPRSSLGPGITFALPVIAAGMLPLLFAGAVTSSVVLGRLGPALMPVGGPDTLLLATTVARIAALSAGVLLAISFLAVRARDGFPRSPDMPLTQLVRTLGLGIVGASAVLGLLNALRLQSGRVVVELVILVVAIVLLLMLVDRHIDADIVVPRATVVAPVVVVVVAYVLAAGGLFRGDLLGGLLGGALAAGLTVAIAALTQTRVRTWAGVPMVIAAHWWPTALSPMPPI